MNSLNLPSEFKRSLERHSLLKVISGLSNFDPSSVKRIATAAGRGGADLLDVACDPDLVRLALDASGLPVCVSSVEPDCFPAAISAGAAMVEIGNFDSFYSQGRIFNADEVLQLTKHTRWLLPEVPLSVTVPHPLALDEQAELALELIDAGANFIQTEGGTSARPISPGVLGLIEKAAPTLAAAHTIAAVIQQADLNVPVFCASGLSSVTLPMAISVGAAGVGVGSEINRLNDELEMIAVVRRLRESFTASKKMFIDSL